MVTKTTTIRSFRQAAYPTVLDRVGHTDPSYHLQPCGESGIVGNAILDVARLGGARKVRNFTKRVVA